MSNRIVISQRVYHRCIICAADQPGNQIKAVHFADHSDAEKAGWIFARKNNKTEAYCPKCRRYGEDE